MTGKTVTLSHLLSNSRHNTSSLESLSNIFLIFTLIYKVRLGVMR